jgi:hypothetical protein
MMLLVVIVVGSLLVVVVFVLVVVLTLESSLHLPLPSPGYGNDFHRNEEYLRDYLVPRQEPSMGEYNDTVPEVILQHLKMTRQANCRVWVAAWFGKGSREDLTLLNTILPTLKGNDPDQRLAIHYETNAQIRKKDTNNLFTLDTKSGKPNEDYYYSVDGRPNDTTDGVAKDMEHFCDNYFKHSNYYTIRGRPVIFVYLTRTLDDIRAGLNEKGDNFYWNANELLASVVKTMRDATMSRCKLNPYIVGDHIFDVYNPTRDDPAMAILDAITGYDMYGHMDQDRSTANGYASEEITGFYQEQAAWKAAANSKKCGYMPSVTPGFNDRAVRLRVDSAGKEKKSLSRRISPTALEGSLMAQTVSRALPLLDPLADNLMMLTTFNEIHEDSQIEPMVVDRKAVAEVLAKGGTQNDVDALKVTNQAWHIWNDARNGYLDPSV